MKNYREQQAEREAWENEGSEWRERLERRNKIIEIVLKVLESVKVPTKKIIKAEVLKVFPQADNEYLEDITSLVYSVRDLEVE